MDDFETTFRGLFIYVVIIGAILGALFGLAPLILGRRRNRARLGLYGFIASIVGGAIAPLLGIIVAGIFSWLVIREKPETGSGGSSADAGDDSASSVE